MRILRLVCSKREVVSESPLAVDHWGVPLQGCFFIHQREDHRRSSQVHENILPGPEFVVQSNRVVRYRVGHPRPARDCDSGCGGELQYRLPGLPRRSVEDREVLGIYTVIIWLVRAASTTPTRTHTLSRS